jgi:hypothetical protein
MWATILSVVSGFLSSLAKSALALLAAKELGRVSSENEALNEQNNRVQEANEARSNADTDPSPDPYLRD